MTGINVRAVLVAAVANVILGMVWYGLFGRHLAESGTAPDRPTALTPLVELVRGVVLAAVVAGLAAGLGVTGWAGALGLGLALWVGFPAVLFSGSIFHEGYPVQLAAIHTGDWLVKLLAISLIVGLWR